MRLSTTYFGRELCRKSNRRMTEMFVHQAREMIEEQVSPIRFCQSILIFSWSAIALFLCTALVADRLLYRLSRPLRCTARAHRHEEGRSNEWQPKRCNRHDVRCPRWVYRYIVYATQVRCGWGWLMNGGASRGGMVGGDATVRCVP